MVFRKIIEIDEEKCNGCGECIPNCAESALKIIDGKARLIKEIYCDGLGACLGHCPQDAIEIIEREAEPFDEETVHKHLEQVSYEDPQATHSQAVSGQIVQDHQLSQWPVQLNLVPLKAPFYDGGDLLVMADCVPVAYPNLHNKLLRGKSIVIGCPKFDNVQNYLGKLTEIIRRNDITCVHVAHMEVPCCSGLRYITEKASEASGKEITVVKRVVKVNGDIE